MKYMLVLQFPETFFQHDELIRFENMLIDKLKNIAKLDGHDIGSNELNFFIFTDDAKLTFDAIKFLLTADMKRTLKAAYREVDGAKYHILYPTNLNKFHIT